MKALRALPADSTVETTLVDAFHTHGKQIRNSVHRICGPHEAADVTQEVFTKLWATRMAAFDPERGSIRQYLVMIARSTAIDHVRSRTAERSRIARNGAQRASEGARGIDADMTDRERVVYVAAAVARLAPDQRDLIRATYFGDMTYRAAAALVGIPEGTAKSRIRIALRQLHSDLHNVIDDADTPRRSTG